MRELLVNPSPRGAREKKLKKTDENIELEIPHQNEITTAWGGSQNDGGTKKDLGEHSGRKNRGVFHRAVLRNLFKECGKRGL